MQQTESNLIDLEWTGYTQLCNVADNRGDYLKALKFAELAASIKPTADSLFHVGIILTKLGRFRDAIEIYRECNKINPDNVLAKYNLAFALLCDKQLKEGLELYELRLDERVTSIEHQSVWELRSNFMGRFPDTRWDGKSRFKHLYLFSEQGMGDLIHFSRYLPCIIEDAKKMDAKITLEVQRNIAPVFKEHFPELEVLPRDNETWPSYRFEKYDMAMSVCSLANFYLSHETQMPYLHCNKENVIKNNKLKIGLCWAGFIGFPNDHTRSIKLSEFKTLPTNDNIEYYSFQMGPMHRSWMGKRINLGDYEFPFTEDLSNKIYDFRDTIDYVNSMDLIISADTALVHLAGALGKPVWLLNPIVSDWRWCPDINPDDNEYSYWYPSVRIFTQKQYGEWQQVFERMRIEIENIVKNPVVN